MRDTARGLTTRGIVVPTEESTLQIVSDPTAHTVRPVIWLYWAA
jgi:hypothetical protein